MKMFRNTDEAVSSLSDIYNVGTFAQIIEMREVGPVMELVLNAQRRIRFLEQLDEAAIEEDPKKPFAKLNGRRNRKPTKDGQKKLDDGEQKPTESYVIFGKTENIKMDTIERTVELKALMQAIVQTVRDIVKYSSLFAQQINLLLHPSQNVNFYINSQNQDFSSYIPT